MRINQTRKVTINKYTKRNLDTDAGSYILEIALDEYGNREVDLNMMTSILEWIADMDNEELLKFQYEHVPSELW